MKAAVVAAPKGFEFAELPAPRPGAEEVLVRVRAAALNHADLGVLAGRMHGAIGGAGTVLGMEWAGEVLAVGSAVTGFARGDRVMGSGRGALAEQVVADQGRVLPLPRADMSWEAAAALPVALQTMHDAIVTHGKLRRGQSVLIQGASSSVGLLGLRIARHLGAALVFGSSRQPATRERLPEFGADLAVDTTDAAWPQRVLEATAGRGVDLVIDMLSGNAMNGNLAATAIGGRIVNVGRLAGQRAEFDFDLHALRRIEYIGVTFRTRSAAEVREVVDRMRADLWPALQAGDLALPVAALYSFDDLGDAFAQLRRGGLPGKLVVSLP
jgi:NADPH2:quinone reductase